MKQKNRWLIALSAILIHPSIGSEAASLIDFEQAIADCGYEITNEKGSVQQKF